MALNVHHTHTPPQLAGPATLEREAGVVLLHGLTSNLRAVAPLRALAEQLGLVVEAPMLRGHGTHPRDLRGVNWHDWMEDVALARARLRHSVPQVVLIGFSMGGLLALASAAEDPAGVAAIVTLAPALRIAHPLAPLVRLASGWMPYVPMGPVRPAGQPVRSGHDGGYDRLATDAFWSFYQATGRVERLLPQVTAPILIAHGRRDRIIRPDSALIAYDRVRSTDKQLVWLDHGTHALLRGWERQVLLEHVRCFLQTRCMAGRPTAADVSTASAFMLTNGAGHARRIEHTS
jgi:carboxylesterase